MCSGGPLSAIDTDLLIVPWFQDESATAVAGVDAASGGEVARALPHKAERIAMEEVRRNLVLYEVPAPPAKSV